MPATAALPAPHDDAVARFGLADAEVPATALRAPEAGGGLLGELLGGRAVLG